MNLRALRRLFPLLVLLSSLVGVAGAQACEKHLQGHQNGSDTNAEAAGR